MLATRVFDLSVVELNAFVHSELEQNPIIEEVEPSSVDPGNCILPDLILQKVRNEYVVTMNEGAIPHLRISTSSESFALLPNASAEVRDYIRAKVAAGRHLIESLEQRQKVLLAIGREIAKFQADFFENRSLDIVPMGLPQAALLAGLVGAKASQTLSNKYIETPLGIFELARFFRKA